MSQASSKYFRSLTFVCLCFLLCIAISQVCILLFPPQPDEVVNPLRHRHRDLGFVAAVFLAPLLETYIFQSFIIKICLKVLPQKARYTRVLSIVLSAFVFALSHNYNVQYQIYTFCVGTVLARYYWYFMVAYSTKYAFYSLAAFHAVLNLLVLLN